MQYITTAERIGIEKGERIGIEKGIEKGTLIGEILLAQRILKKTGHSPKELEMKSLDELKNIFGVLEVKLTEH